MIQVALQEPGRFVINQASEPVAAAGEALVRIERIGVCGTDIHAFHGRHPFIKYPVVLGHELAGTIIQSPANDRGISVGDKVSVEPFRPCGECHACRIGKPNCCQNMYVIGVHGDGGMQPILAAPLERVHRSSKLSLDQLALIEPLSIGAHAVLRSGLTRGEPVLIVGAGPIGIAAIHFASIGGGAVTVVEPNDARRRWVGEVCAVEAIAAPDGRQFDVVIDATGHPQAMEQSFHHVAYGGRLVFVGVIKARIAFDDALLHAKEITLLASRNSHQQFPGIIRLVEDGRFDPQAWITHRLPLEDVPSRFEQVVAAPGVVKIVIDVGANLS